MSRSKIAQEKTEKMRAYLDGHMTKNFVHIAERNQRRKELEEEMDKMKLDPAVRKQMIKNLEKEEKKYASKRRKRLKVDDFDKIKVIGRGAFGEVRVVRKKRFG